MRNQFEESEYFLKKALCNSIWLFKTELVNPKSLTNNLNFDEKKYSLRVRKIMKYLILILLNYFVLFSRKKELEKVKFHLIIKNRSIKYLNSFIH